MSAPGAAPPIRPVPERIVIPGAGALGAGLGLAALRRLRSSYATGTTQAWAGVVVGGVSTVAWIWVMLLISLP